MSDFMKYLKHSTDIDAYMFQADLFCPGCIGEMFADETDEADGLPMNTEAILERAAMRAGIDNQDEYSYDSDEFPKVVFCDQLHSADEEDEDAGIYADVCGRCHTELA